MTEPGTATLDYWAVVPSSQQWLHATRTVIVSGAAIGASDSSTPDATSSLPILDSALSIVPDYSTSTTESTSTLGRDTLTAISA